MNNRKLWISKQILKYSATPRSIKLRKNHTLLQNLNKSITIQNNRLLQIQNLKRLMSSDSATQAIGRHCFHKELEDIMNEQAIEEFNAAYAYLTMALHFGRTDIALPGCQGFFMNMYEEELGHATIFLNYVLMRGGHATLKDIKVPECTKYDVRGAFKTAMKMEMHIKERLSAVNDVAEKHKDLHVMDLISTEFMEEQNRSICEMARLYTRSKMVDTHVGEHLFDQFIFKSFVATEKDNLMNKRNLDLEKSKFDVYR
ncbi:unnamed protein product [Psylliodes chrysocephalus]|uniref:Ferritin n=1 Tax=Psylliodes chrysocephalus TaxID=3402493 RepID=A0A9P0D571_9CUCU|nr:unnamed protein product [Psylliodes chrysocephala]